MAETMKAVDIRDGAGPAEALFVTQIPKPKATGNLALVKIKAFGLNRMDLIQREGHYPLPPQAPKTLGVEFSGTIESLGDQADKSFKVGDEVFGLAYGGAYAEYIAVSSRMLIHKPTELSWVQCAAIPETWITATQAMYLVGGFAPGKTILWHSGASSVSIAGIQLSKGDSAAAVYATTRSDEKCRFCVDELGATAAFNATTTDWADEVLKATGGKGVDLIVDIGALIFKRLRYQGSTLRSRDEEYQGKLRDQLFEHALPSFRSGRFKVPVERTFKMEEIVEAHKLMESNQTKGKLIVVLD